MSVKLVALPSILFVVVLGVACGDGSPAAPSPTPSPTPAAPPPAPSPVPGASDLEGEWKLTLRVTAVSGSGCVADTMRSQIGEASPYSLVISQTGAVTLKSKDRACTFTPVIDSSGFTTFGKGGYYTCDQFGLSFHCADGTLHSIVTFGEDISGRLSGTELTGAWQAFWVEGIDDVGVEMKAEFTGTR
jgi:hypothetical protein